MTAVTETEWIGSTGGGFTLSCILGAAKLLGGAWGSGKVNGTGTIFGPGCRASVPTEIQGKRRDHTPVA